MVNPSGGLISKGHPLGATGQSGSPRCTTSALRLLGMFRLYLSTLYLSTVHCRPLNGPGLLRPLANAKPFSTCKINTTTNHWLCYWFCMFSEVLHILKVLVNHTPPALNLHFPSRFPAISPPPPPNWNQKLFYQQN